MKKYFAIIISIFLFFIPLLRGQNSLDDLQTYLIRGGDVLISIETYKQNDGWTPVIVNIDSLEINLWKDVYGRVTETIGDKPYMMKPIFLIDTNTCEIIIGKNRIQTTIHQDEVRTRIRISDKRLRPNIEINRSKKFATLKIGENKLNLRHNRVALLNVEKGICEIEIRGLNVNMKERLILIEELGEIFSIRAGRSTPEPEKEKIWVKFRHEEN